MRKFILIAALAATAFMGGCGSVSYNKVRTKASDPDVISTVTGEVVSIETKHRTALTVTNTTAAVVTSQQGASALGLAAFAVDVLDHQAAKSRENYTEVKLINEATGKEVIWDSGIDSLPQYVDTGDRVRFISKKYGAEAFYNLTRNPKNDALTR